MNNEEQLKDNAERAESVSHVQSDLSALLNSASSRIKVSDDLNSNEILVFTSHHNVYKVQKKEIRDKFQALQKIEFEPG